MGAGRWCGAWQEGSGVGVSIASDWHTEMVTEGGVC